MATPQTESWIEQRILQFINQARRVEDITEATQLQDTDGGYLIGPTVAQRVLDQKKDLDRRRYTSLAQLDAIPGIGTDKLNDLIASFDQTADDYFAEALFDGILLDNWSVAPVQFSFETDDIFQAVAQNESNFRRAVAQMLTESDPRTDLIVRHAYLESYPDAHLAAFQFAFWFYLFDQDNWFSYAVMKDAIESYLTYHSGREHRLVYRQFRLYNPTPGNSIGRQEIVPVIVNPAERMLTIWEVDLND